MSLNYDLETTTPHTVANTTGIGRGNAGAVSLRNFTIAIDSTIYAKTALIFRQNLEKYFNLPIKFLIFTHYHADHIFGIGPFRDIITISSEQMIRNMNSKNIKEQYNLRVKQFPKEDPLAEGVEFELPHIGFHDKLIIHDEDLFIEILHLGGHTSGTSIIYFPYEKVIFAGDLIFANYFPYAGDPTCNPEKYIEALRIMKNLNAELIIPGHGKVLKGKNSLDIYIDFFKEFRKSIKNAIEDNIPLDKIDIPHKFEVFRDDMKKSSIEHWYKFFKKSENL
ncbi:MAG: MBL fold metallo-hydrolase [Promethearchaeota archaeon]